MVDVAHVGVGYTSVFSCRGPPRVDRGEFGRSMGDLKSHHGSVLQCFFVASAAQWAINTSHLHPQRSGPPACRTVFRIMCHELRVLDAAHDFVVCLNCNALFYNLF